MRFFTKKFKGFTIVEMMIVVAILGILGISLTRYFRDVFVSWDEASDQILAQNQARNAVYEMSKFIRQSSSPVTALTPAVGTTSYSELSFIYVGTGGNTNMKYFKQSDKLYRVKGGVTSTIITSGLQSIYFAHVSSYVVHVGNIVVQQDDKEIVLEKWIYLRNK
ncbi:type II secretion system protein J [bacterium]